MGQCAPSKEARATSARRRARLPRSAAIKQLRPLALTIKQPTQEKVKLFIHAAAAARADEGLPQGSLLPFNEGEQIKAVHQLNALRDDPEANERLNRILDMLCTTFMVDHAALTLLGVDKQWFKASAGFTLDPTDLQSAFGSWVLAAHEQAMLVVEDALEDARFCNNKHVTGPPNLRFCAGAPLVGSNTAVYGVLWIADRKPRRFAAEQLTILANFAELCTRKLEMPRLPELERQAEAAQQGHGTPLIRAVAKLQEPILLCNLATERWELRWANHELADLAGISQESVPGRDVWSLFSVVGDPEEVMAECDASIFCKQPFTVAVRRAGRDAQDGVGGVLEMRFRPASHGLPASDIPLVGIPSFVDSQAAGASHDPLASGFEHLFWAQVAPAGTSASRGQASAAGTVAPAFGGPPASPGAHSCGVAPSCQLASCGASGSSFSCGGSSIGASPGHLAALSCGRGASFSVNMAAGQMRGVSFTVPAQLARQDAVFDMVALGPLLGSGSYGRVYRGLWRGVGVAVKVMEMYCPPVGSYYEITAEKHSALLEALLGRDLTRHPALVQTYDFGLRPTNPLDPDDPPQGPVRHTLWVVNELYNRGTLGEAVVKGRFRNTPSDKASGPSMLSVLLTAQEIAGGMSLLHDAGMIHSDLSANNVLLKAAANRRRFTVGVSDFGLSRICTDTDGQHTQTVGTVTHQPPELLREGILTPAADCYAFGILLWTMYCGEHPFSGLLPYTIIHKVVSSLRCPLELPADAPQGFKDLFERCVAYDRTQRPTFHQILTALAPLVDQAEAEAPPPSPPGASPTRVFGEGERDFMQSPSFAMR